MKPVIGEYHPLAQWAMSECPYSLSYLAHEWPDVDTWRNTACSKVLELLSYQPPETPLNPRVERKEERDGVVVELISYEQPWPAHRRIFAIPSEAERPSTGCRGSA